MSSNFYPLLFVPVLKDYIWGGRNLETRLGRELPADTIIAESWEIAAHKDGTATVSNGVHAGKLLTDLLEEMGLDLIGSKSKWAMDRELFPLLIKILVACWFGQFTQGILFNESQDIESPTPRLILTEAGSG